MASGKRITKCSTATPTHCFAKRRWMTSLGLFVLATITFGREWDFFRYELPSIDRGNETVAKHYNQTQQAISIQQLIPSTSLQDTTDHFSNFSIDGGESTPVFILPILPGTECPNAIYEEGAWNSNAINVISNINSSMLHSPFVWLHQAMSNRWGPVCFPELLDQAREFYRYKRNSTLPSFSRNRSQWEGAGSIHVLDWFDRPDQIPRCQNMEEMAGTDHVHYWKRSIVEGRRWNNATRSIELGQVISEIDGVPVNFLPYAVRSDEVDAINKYVQHIAPDYETTVSGDFKTMASIRRTNQKMNATALTEYLVTKDRPVDVVHYWPVNGSNGGISRGGRGHDNSILRTVTSETLLELRNPPHNVPNVLCDVQGEAGRRGRATVTNDYVESMLSYKIIVVVQRDEWEGHFRLFEAMISGAMVIHDRMLAVPLGMKENENIVIFDSMEELKDKVTYYLKNKQERLEIARRGRKLAMCHHRSWHRLEQIIFGRTITPCDE